MWQCGCLIQIGKGKKGFRGKVQMAARYRYPLLQSASGELAEQRADWWIHVLIFNQLRANIGPITPRKYDEIMNNREDHNSMINIG